MGLARHTHAPIAILDRRRIADFDRRGIVDQEFGEDYRDAQFPSGWYVLPFVGAGGLVAALMSFFF